MTSLACYPGIGGKRRELAQNPLCFPVSSWLIFYRAIPNRTGIEITRVIGHETRHQFSVLSENDEA